MTTREKRWRPPSFNDPTMNTSMKGIFDNVYDLEDRCVISAVRGAGMASGITAVTSNRKGIATGLATVLNVVGCIQGIAASNLWITARPTPNDPGKIELYVWMPTAAGSTVPIANTAAVNVGWIAWGTPINTENA